MAFLVMPFFAITLAFDRRVTFFFFRGLLTFDILGVAISAPLFGFYGMLIVRFAETCYMNYLEFGTNYNRRSSSFLTN
jgi:hypothetical protein